MSLEEELVGESYSRRNWKGIALAILVICATVAIIVVTVIYTTKENSRAGTTGTLNLDDILNQVYHASTFNGTFASENEIVYLDFYGNFVLYNLQYGNYTRLIENTTLEMYDTNNYLLSPTKDYVLIAYDMNKEFRHSYTSKYKLYNIATKELKDIHQVVGNKSLQYVAWGPTDNRLVYVYNNNIYYMKSLDQAPQNVTNDGIPGIVYNGVPDWVYEEEVLSSSNAIWWAPDSSKFCFAQFNDTQVDAMNYMWYGSYENVSNVYPKVMSVRYPKPGRMNPTSKLFVVDVVVDATKRTEVMPPSDISGEYYFTTLTWLDPKRLLVVWVPRLQVKASFSVCSDSNSWKCTENTLQTSDGWVSFYDQPIFTDSAYFLKLPLNKNFEHLAMISLNDTKPVFLTGGNFEVTKIKSFSNGMVYYERTGEDAPNVRQIASIGISGNSKENCLTCDIDSNCTYNSAIIGPKNKYYVWLCGGTSVPRAEIRSLPDNALVATWTTNENLKTRLEKQVLPKIQTIRVPLKGGYEAVVKLYLPDDFSEKKKYPLIVNVYGGPGTQINTDAYTVDWGYYLATVKKYIYVQIDGRGSAYRGDKLMFEIYKHLGTVEIEDQIAAVKYLIKNKHFVDANRTAIWGWSYGGYASAMALANGDDTFKCGISVAPVTSWYYYDSIYTERYMQRPQDNLASYNFSSVLWRAKNFKDKKFLLIHGTADDNVHVQQSMMLIEALSSQGVLFNSHFYPDQDHSIAKYKQNLYHTLQQFVDDCFH